MGFTCSNDFGATLYSQSYPIARKEYWCDECQEPIALGDMYSRVFGVFDGYPETHIACERCGDLISSFEDLGFCWTWHNFLEDYRDWLQCNEDEYPDWLCQILKIEKWKQRNIK